MTYLERLLIMIKYYDGVPCTCVTCTNRRMKKAREESENHVRHSTMASTEFKTKKAAREWIAAQLPLCRDQLPTA